jgi:4-hydroxy-tetrahydrodipicolinate synthase
MRTPFKSWTPQGVIPATLLPFNDDFTVDLASFKHHLRDVCTTAVAAVTVNGHASEVSTCSPEEQKLVLDTTMDEIGDRVPVICGIFADGGLEAARIARMAEQAGASALLVFPPPTLGMGGHLRPEMVIQHFRMIADATDLPLILFQYSVSSGLAYPFETLLAVLDAVPSIRAIKDWSEPILHERHIRTLQSLPNPVNVLSTNSSWLLSSLVMGAKGLLSGAGSVVADLQLKLFNAVQNNDLALARSINDQLYPIQQAFYAPPFLDMHNRMKQALVMLGRLPRATVRPPLLTPGQTDLNRLRQALLQSGLLKSENA